MIYNKVEKNKLWLDFAIHGAEFLKKYGRDAEGNWYFSLTREEKPLAQPFNIFSDCFAAMGFGQLYQATGNGEFSDSFECRLINPGLGLEAMWFIMELAVRRDDKALIKKAVAISLDILEYGWDKKYGGIFYFPDIKGYPPEKLEWDQKLWWVHVEAPVCMLKGYFLSGDERCWQWFEKIHQYTWDRFPDKEYSEWFAYLNRQGEPLLSLKGGKWKGCCLNDALFLFLRKSLCYHTWFA